MCVSSWCARVSARAAGWSVRAWTSRSPALLSPTRTAAPLPSAHCPVRRCFLATVVVYHLCRRCDVPTLYAWRLTHTVGVLSSVLTRVGSCVLACLLERTCGATGPGKVRLTPATDGSPRQLGEGDNVIASSSVDTLLEHFHVVLPAHVWSLLASEARSLASKARLTPVGDTTLASPSHATSAAATLAAAQQAASPRVTSIVPPASATPGSLASDGVLGAGASARRRGSGLPFNDGRDGVGSSSGGDDSAANERGIAASANANSSGVVIIIVVVVIIIFIVVVVVIISAAVNVLGALALSL